MNVSIPPTCDLSVLHTTIWQIFNAPCNNQFNTYFSVTPVLHRGQPLFQGHIIILSVPLAQQQRGTCCARPKLLSYFEASNEWVWFILCSAMRAARGQVQSGYQDMRPGVVRGFYRLQHLGPRSAISNTRMERGRLVVGQLTARYSKKVNQLTEQTR